MKTTNDYIAEYLLSGLSPLAIRVHLWRDGVPAKEIETVIAQVTAARGFSDQQMARVQ